MVMNQLTLSWRDHNNVLISVFENLLKKKALVDCTLAAEGHFIKAHRIVLSACSPYLENLLNQETDKHPIIFLRDVKYSDLQALVTFMYSGVVQISEDRLEEFLNIAKSLQIKELGDVKNKTKGNEHYCEESQQQESSLPVSNKRVCCDSSGLGSNSYNNNEIASNKLVHASDVHCGEETVLDNLNTSNITTVLSRQKLVCEDLDDDDDDIKIEEEVMNCQSSCSEVSRENHLDNVGVSSDMSIPSETVAAERLCADVKEEVHILQAIISSPKDVEQFVNDSTHSDAGEELEELAPRFEQVTCTEEFADDMYGEETVLEINPVGNQHNGDEYSGYSLELRDGLIKESSVVRQETEPLSSKRPELFVQPWPSSSAQNVHYEQEASASDSVDKNEDGASSLEFIKRNKKKGKYQCSFCPKSFSFECFFRRHIVTHTGEKAFKCSYCDATFSLQANMKRHIRIHTGEKPYHCTICERSFNLSQSLKKHLVTHTGEGNYVCDHCSARYKSKRGLVAHTCPNVEKPYPCTVCQKSFSQKQSLRRHFLRHQCEDKPSS